MASFADVEQAEPRDAAGRAFHAVRVGKRAAQHLVAAAQAQHPSAPPHMGGDVDVPAGAAQRGEVGDRAFRARQEHQVADRQGGAGPDQREGDAGLVRRSDRIYHYQADNGRANEISALLSLYDDDKVVVLRSIAQLAIERVRSQAASRFADAFVIRPRKKKDEPDG